MAYDLEIMFLYTALLPEPINVRWDKDLDSAVAALESVLKF